jgi:uncharacterized protein YjeT (DUF2065 family)
MASDLRKLKKFGLPAAVLIVVIGAVVGYLLRGGFRRFEIAPYKVPPPAFMNWNDVLRHTPDICLVTFQTGVAPHGWNQAGTARAYLSLAQLRDFAISYPKRKTRLWT